MSSGLKNDALLTKSVLEGESPKILQDGNTWLRHEHDTQSALIDILILEGEHTHDAIVDRLIGTFGVGRIKNPTAENIRKARKIKLDDHIKHLMNREANNMKPHGLKVTTDKKGKLYFKANS